MVDGITITHVAGTTSRGSHGVYVYHGGKLTLSSGSISGNTLTGSSTYPDNNGGGVYNAGDFTMTGGTISGNTLAGTGSTRYGGGVYNTGIFTLTGGTITGNAVSGTGSGRYGGGVHNNAGTFTMTGGTISGNTAQIGAGVYVSNTYLPVMVIGTFTMTGGTISNNPTTGGGGAGVYSSGDFTMSGTALITENTGGGVFMNFDGNYNCTFTMEGGTISDNISTYGGGVHTSGSSYGGSTFTMEGGTISGNTATTGGGVYNSGVFNMGNGTILGNTATDGGGVYNSGPSAEFTMAGGAISENTADTDGGGVFNYCTFTLTDGIISGNTAVNGSGVYNIAYYSTDFPGVFTMSGGTISGNTADSSGGGVYVTSYVTGNALAVFTLSGGVIGGSNSNDANSAVNGSGVYNDVGTFTMSSSAVIMGNTAVSNGGGVYNVDTFTMSSGTISSNTAGTTTASQDGGGVYNSGSNAIFTMSGGVIGGSDNGSEGNSAYNGGGVYNAGGIFRMLGDAAVLGNRATFGGGVYNSAGSFDLGDSASSEIVSVSSNTATSNGGGVYNTGNVSNPGVVALFSMFGNAVISDNSAGIDGGGVFNVNSGVFNMFDGAILTNTAGTGGGGVVNSGEFTMSAGKISGNSARGAGGVLNYYNFNMTGGEISDNTSQSYGGGVENNASSALGTATFTMSGDSIISNNLAANGGGVYNADGRYAVSTYAIFIMSDHATISDNHAISRSLTAGRGGGVHNCNRGILTMTGDAKITNNDATYGGGVFNDFDCTVNMSDDTVISSNTVSLYGGGVYNWNPYYPSSNPSNPSFPSIINISGNAIISDNSAEYGGGIQNTDNGLLIISEDAVISKNIANYGGGIYTISSLPVAVKIEGGTIVDNSAHHSGGGVYTSSKIYMDNGVIADNTATVNGGGVYAATGSFFELIAGRVSGNTAGNNGGGIWVTNTDDVVTIEKLYIADGVVFSDNTASVLISLTELSVLEEGVYRNQVKITDGLWSNDERFGINNYDISYTSKCIVIYDPGTQGTWRAEAETFGDLAFGSSTPVFGTASGADYTVDHIPGWSFAGWLPAWSATVSGNITYIAQWIQHVEPQFYTLNYDGNGFTSGDVPIGGSYPAGYLIFVAGQGSMVREGFVFRGWAYSPDATVPSFGAGVTSYFILTRDVTLFAVWEVAEGPPSLVCRVSYVPGTYGTFEPVSFVCVLGDVTPGAPLVTGQPGWRFVGWAPKPTPTVEGDATYVAQWEPDNLAPSPSPSSTPTPNPTSAPSPSPTRGPTPSPSPTPTSGPTYSPSPTPIPSSSLTPSPSPSIPGGNVDEAPVWALVNLILSVVGAILAIILTVWVLLQRNQKQKKQPTQEQTQGTKGQYRTNQKQKNEENNDHTVDEKKQKQRRLFWFLLSVILGIAGIVVFLLTEDMTRPMAMVDRWTIVNVIIFVVELIAIALTFKHKNNKDQTVSYTVQYYLQGTRNPVAASKASAFGTVGFSVTEYAPSIVGYTVAGRSTASLTLDKDAAKNVIVFYYTLNTDKDKTEQQK